MQPCAVKSTDQCDKIELDYSDMNIVPNFNPQGVTFDSNNCYAPRQGGGSYIPNIGSTFFSMKKSGGATTGDSDEFYNFMSGSIPWTNGITLDANLYHQYAAACVMPTMDNSGRIAKNLMPGKNVGDLQEPTLPNIKGTTCYNTDNASGEFKTHFEGAFSEGTNRYQQSNFNSGGYLSYTKEVFFNASQSNSIYQDGAGVNQKAVYQQQRLQLF